jgi:hypothetical protein
LANFDKVARGFVVKEGEDKDQARKHDVDGGWNDLNICQLIAEIGIPLRTH